jgi:transcription-repair coupling factor (superfamily II helicase)
MVDELEEELLDRFGPLPPEGHNLLQVVRLKHDLRRLGVKRLDMQDGVAVLQFADPERLDLRRLMELVRERPKSIRISPDQSLKMRLMESGSPWARLTNCLKEVATFVKGD